MTFNDIVLVLEFYWNCCFSSVYCIGIGISPNMPVLWRLQPERSKYFWLQFCGIQCLHIVSFHIPHCVINKHTELQYIKGLCSYIVYYLMTGNVYPSHLKKQINEGLSCKGYCLVALQRWQKSMKERERFVKGLFICFKL